MLSMIGITDAHLNIGYWSKAGYFIFLNSSCTHFTTSFSIVNCIQLLMWISFTVYNDIKKFPPYSFDSLNVMLGILLWFMLSLVHMYTMAYDPKNNISILKSLFGFINSAALVPSLFLMLPFCGKDFLGGLCIPQVILSWICVPFVCHRVCGASHYFLDGMYEHLNYRNMLSFCVDV